MTFLILAVIVILFLSFVNMVACWFGVDIAAEPEPNLVEAGHGGRSAPGMRLGHEAAHESGAGATGISGTGHAPH